MKSQNPSKQGFWDFYFLIFLKTEKTIPHSRPFFHKKHISLP